MKKIWIFLALLLVGCTNSSYDNFVTKARNSSESNNIPFNIEFHIDDSDDLLVYQVIIDGTSDLSNVKAIVIHNVKTDNIFPSIGVVDDSVSLDGNTKGINLIGYVPKQDIEFKVYIESNNNSYTYIYRYNMPK